MQCVMQRKQRRTIKVNHCIETGGLVNFHCRKHLTGSATLDHSTYLFQHVGLQGIKNAEDCEQAFMKPCCCCSCRFCCSESLSIRFWTSHVCKNNADNDLYVTLSRHLSCCHGCGYIKLCGFPLSYDLLLNYAMIKTTLFSFPFTKYHLYSITAQPKPISHSLSVVKFIYRAILVFLLNKIFIEGFFFVRSIPYTSEMFILFPVSKPQWSCRNESRTSHSTVADVSTAFLVRESGSWTRRAPFEVLWVLCDRNRGRNIK